MSSEETIKKLKRKRASIKSRLTIFSKFVQDLQITFSAQQKLENEGYIQLEARLSGIELLMKEFNDIQDDIEATVDEEELEAQYAERENFYTSFFTETSNAKKLMSTNSSVALPNIQSELTMDTGIPFSHNTVKLPPIEVPKFRGDYESWLEFRETFESLIHTSNALSNVQKYHYLKVSLSENAAQVIASLDFSANNYSVAWGLLCDRYNNTRLLIQNHLKAIFNIQINGKGSSESMRSVIDSLSKHLKALKHLNQPTEAWDTLIIYIITSKLDISIARDWEEFISNKPIPILDDLKSFLKSKADLLETLELKQIDNKTLIPNKNKNTRTLLVNKANGNSDNTQAINTRSNSNPISNCPLCKADNHYIRNCPDFLKLSPDGRLERSKQLNLCTNCLRYGHRNSVCRLSNCRKCNGRHNTLLHQTKPDRNPERSHNTQNTTDVSTSLTSSDATVGQTLLSTVLLQIVDDRNQVHTVRAILDSASQSNFVTTDLCRRLNLNTKQISIAVSGINNVMSNIKFQCQVNIQSQHNNFKASLPCLVIDRISGLLPSCLVDRRMLKIPENILLADPSFYKPGKIDILLGANVFWDTLLIGQIKLGCNFPVLQKTVFGWVVSGPLGQASIEHTNTFFTKTIDVQSQLSKFWALEECTTRRLWSQEEILCEEHFKLNTKRENGRFVVTIPFKDSLSKLGESKTQAEKRFILLEKKLSRNETLQNEYVKFMREYEELGHMRKVSNFDNHQLSYYMPHHGVIKESSLTTRLRVVFDCSAATSSGISVNDLQMVGPTIQNDLLSILLRFRVHAFVVAADIAKMYRQVLVSPEQYPLQRILWRYDSSQPIDTYELQTVTYGTSSAAFLAIRCLFQLGLDCQNTNPEISEIIKNDFYVDDVLFGADSIERASELGQQLSQALLSGGFELRKWQSNSPDIIKGITLNETSSTGVLQIDSESATKTLGLAWSSASDRLIFNIGAFSKDGRVSKRVILSCVSQIFDPLGLLSPCIISVKILLQKLWLEKLSWDESVPLAIHTSWLHFKNDIPILNKISIPRNASCTNCKSIELHCFSDASQQAYGSCAYIRSEDHSGDVHVHLICSKTKVAPLKVITIPKLELCGALIASQLAHKIRESLRIKLDRVVCWTDSSIVLGWLKKPPSTLKIFVGNRVAEIQELTSDYSWRHISTKDNPADILSRGISPRDIENCNLWWQGPSWLKGDEIHWPHSVMCSTDLPELKTENLLVSKYQNYLIDFNRFSSLSRLRRSMAYVFRFIENCKCKQNKECGSLTACELSRAFLQLVKISQYESFPEEIKLKSETKQLTSKSKLFSLNPFLDENGLLRVGGRLKNSEFHKDKKHPLIISSKHPLCKLIFKHEHLKSLHAGPQLLLSTIRETLWPISGRNLARATVRECITCFKCNPKVLFPIMGDLPKKRLEANFPFTVCGVDYGGPFTIKDRKGRGCKTTKCYLALFVCFSVKAVHLELVSDLTTDAFILALKRFISRRGKPTMIYSDNGTNFVGANAELKKLAEFLRNNEQKIIQSCANDDIEWRFIPTNSPHFGGLWEAGIKSSKYHLKRVVGSNILTFEELYSVFTQIEAVLNSRPISPLTVDPNDLNPLTPAHFLVGRLLTCTSEADLSHLPPGRLDRYQLLEQCRQQFWSRWSKEYVSELQQRAKWRQNHGKVAEGALVLIKDDHLLPMCWKLGRIVCLHPGKDGVVRVVSIQTMSGTVKRALHRICPLPSDTIESQLFQGGGHVEDDKLGAAMSH